jgi:hypothetical protein
MALEEWIGRAETLVLELELPLAGSSASPPRYRYVQYDGYEALIPEQASSGRREYFQRRRATLRTKGTPERVAEELGNFFVVLGLGRHPDAVVRDGRDGVQLRVRKRLDLRWRVEIRDGTGALRWRLVPGNAGHEFIDPAGNVVAHLFWGGVLIDAAANRVCGRLVQERLRITLIFEDMAPLSIGRCCSGRLSGFCGNSARFQPRHSSRRDAHPGSALVIVGHAPLHDRAGSAPAPRVSPAGELAGGRVRPSRPLRAGAARAAQSGR